MAQANVEQPQTLSIEHEGMQLVFFQDDHQLHQYSFNPSQKFQERTQGLAAPNFLAAIAGKSWGLMGATTCAYSEIPLQSKLESSTINESGLQVRYLHADTSLAVHVEMEFIPNTAVIRMKTTAINKGDQPIILTHLSSLMMSGIASDGLLHWCDPRKIRIRYCRQTWEGEGQWREGGLEELGVYPVSVHPETSAFHIESIGAFSTGCYYPCAFIEDLETGKIWYFQLETSSNWHYEIGRKGDWEGSKGCLYIHADAADERRGGWAHKLEPGERFEAATAAIGCCNGGLEEAVRQLTRYRRSIKPPMPEGVHQQPLVYNDYMNTLWADPNTEKLTPLIEAAAKVGAETFCIDAGWFGETGSSWGDRLGIWNPSPDRFGESGLQGILDLIRSKGMTPGLWLEMEVCGEKTNLAQSVPNDWFLCRYGRRVGGGPRLFFNFSNPEVRNYIHGVIDRLVKMGVGFFKNDYNDCPGIGDDTLGTTAAAGLVNHSRAFYSFIDEVRQHHPRLMIENCGSGAMRSDPGILTHFHIQSSSDQEIEGLYPSIITGSLANILPEQLGIWAYPMPHYFLERQQEVFDSETYKQRMQDGEVTIFNIVNGLCGTFYLSGRIDKADELNLSLIYEGCDLYKHERTNIHSSYPIWPLGMTRIHQPHEWACVGFLDEYRERVLLAVWRLDSPHEEMEIPIPDFISRRAQATQLYPSKEAFATGTTYNANRGALTVKLPKRYQARYFELKAF